MPNYTEGISAITCTGGRPEALQLCSWFISRQTWRGPFQWIVVDDVEALDWGPQDYLTLVYPEPKWHSGQNTLARNLLAAIPHVRYDKILFLEDDDWVAEDYFTTMYDRLQESAIIGSPVSHYYHVPKRLYRKMVGSGYASLCQTGIRSSLLPILERVCNSPQFIDLRLWQSVHLPPRPSLEKIRVVGIKGLPGRPGIGVGHRPDGEEWLTDPDMTILASMIGADVELYRRLM